MQVEIAGSYCEAARLLNARQLKFKETKNFRKEQLFGLPFKFSRQESNSNFFIKTLHARE